MNIVLWVLQVLLAVGVPRSRRDEGGGGASGRGRSAPPPG